jgi:hypothetical protein
MASLNTTATSQIQYNYSSSEWYFFTPIFNDITNAINSSSLTSQSKSDALSVLTDLTNYFNNNTNPQFVPETSGSYNSTIFTATGIIEYNIQDNGYQDSTGNVTITITAADPAPPSVVLQLPTATVNTGVAYTVSANAATSGVSTLVAVVIEYYNGSAWVQQAADSGSLGTNHTNGGNPKVSTSVGSNTTVQWRAWAEDNYGQKIYTSVQTININAIPAISFEPYSGFPPATVVNGTGANYIIYALGADPDTEAWGKLQDVHIDVNINNTGWQQFAALPPGVGSWPMVSQYCNDPFNQNLNYTYPVQFRAWSNDANGAESGYIYWDVSVTQRPTPTPTPTVTRTPTPTPTPTFTPSVYIVQALNSTGGLQTGFNGDYSGNPIYNVSPGNYTIDAVPVNGYVFSYWRIVSGSTAIANIYSQNTSVLISSNVQMMAMFAQNPATPTPTPTVTATPPPPTPTPTPTVTPTPTLTPTPTPTPTVTFTPLPGATATPTPTPTVTPTPTPTVTPTITPTPTVTPTPVPAQLSVYTPWVVVQTGTPVWIESIYPISKFIDAYDIFWAKNGALSADWQQQSYIANGFGENFLLYTYLSASPGTSYFSISARVGSQSIGKADPRTLTNRLYVKDTIPTYDIDSYFDPVTQTPILPYSLSDVLVGSNEWVVSDVINSSFSKLNDNFNYLKNISQVLKLNNELSLIEWCAQLCANTSVSTVNASAFAWKTDIDGLNWDNSFQSISAVGIADGNIKDFKSYRFTSKTAPDYYNYIAYSLSASVPDHIQIRTNDWRHTLVLSATSLGDNIPNFNCISAIDVLNNQLYILDNDTVYRAGISILPPPQGGDGSVINSKLLTISQVGGVSGTRTVNTGFNVPTEIKAYNDLVYVCDSLNSCVKVYNTALSWVKTLYVDALSAYSAERIEINRANENTFILAKTFAPVAPVITSLSALGVVGGNTTVYRIIFDHDGLRLKNNTTNVLSAFALYGLLSGGQSYSQLTSAVMLSATYSAPLTVTYLAASGAKYTDFKIQALGNNGFNSDLSNNLPTPTNYYLESPYKVFEINSNSELVNSFDVPNNLEHVDTSQNIQSTTVIKKMVIDPTGAFLYFLTSSNVYKYLTNGAALNRLTDPSKSSLGSVEDITTGFIDDRLNFYVVTNKRIFKYVDIPDTLDLFDSDTVNSLVLPLSSVDINKEEFVQDWVYNKSIMRLLQNHEVLYKAIKYKYKINLDRYGNLINTDGGASSFTITGLSGTDLVKSFSVSQDSYIHSNELVTSSVINRVLTKLYNTQLDMLQLVSPRINRTLPQPNNDL